MTFETADKAAARLGVSVRAIQKWAKEGKIPYSHKVGRDWMIPISASRPGGQGGAFEEKCNAVFPLMHSFTSGNIMDQINLVADEDQRKMSLCEYYYMTGQLKECTITVEPYLDSPNRALRSMAALYCAFSNLCRGHLTKTSYSSDVMKSSLDNSMGDNTPPKVRAFCVMSSLSAKLQLHLPLENVPRMRGYLKYLDGGTRLFGCYLVAYDEYMQKNYAKALGIVDTALNLERECYVLPTIYLYLLSAIAHINLLETDKAKKCIESAWELAYPNDFIMPFVEHYNLFQGLLEGNFKKDHLDFYNKIIFLSKQYNSSWYEVYNKKSERAVATNLTNVEFTIAMLYSRNWRVKEIAAHMNLSERTITNYISYIYDKLQINSKKDLEKYMLR